MELLLCTVISIFRQVRPTDQYSGPIIFLGGLLLLITSILEFILGNTFPCVVFGTIGTLVSIELFSFAGLVSRLTASKVDSGSHSPQP